MPGITRTIGNWDVNNNYVERMLDNAAYTSAHPDDTLVLAGPARKSSIVPGELTGIGSLMALGQLEMLNLTSTQPVQPLQAIGSARTFYSVGKAMHQLQIGRLVMNGRNLLRAIYHNLVAAGVDAADPDLGNPASYTGTDNQQFFANLDSPLYRVPFGLGVLFRDRAKNHIGGLYLELCIIQNWSLSVASGQAMIMENVSMLCDQIKPFGDSSTVSDISLDLDEVLDLIGNGDSQETIDDAGSADQLA